MHTLIRTGLALTVGLPAALGLAVPAYASIGVGIQSNPVRLGGVAHPGSTYALPSLYVINTGTQAESVSVRVERLSTGSGPGLSVPGSWIQISGQGTQLAPDQSALISLELHTPGNAQPGSYATDLVATGSIAGTSGDVNFGAAAATGLEFSVTPGPGSAVAAWRWWLFVALIVLAAIVVIVRRTGLRIHFELRGTHA
ncbi:MAG TPA: hypothetical protein VN969_17980 [Streptosporangiaceae bacterium]|nr:hypothetical protein [Streptosporangiaceae bacterium]